MRIRQPFPKQPIPRFGGGSIGVFIFVTLCGSWPAQHSPSHTERALSRKASALGLTQSDVTRTCNQELHKRSRCASTIVKMRTSSRSLDDTKHCALARQPTLHCCSTWLLKDKPDGMGFMPLVIGLGRQHVWESTKLLSQFRCPSRINPDRTPPPEQFQR